RPATAVKEWRGKSNGQMRARTGTLLTLTLALSRRRASNITRAGRAQRAWNHQTPVLLHSLSPGERVRVRANQILRHLLRPERQDRPARHHARRRAFAEFERHQRCRYIDGHPLRL